jgi:uncharacterized repeat protein (TIGR01451 family)
VVSGGSFSEGARYGGPTRKNLCFVLSRCDPRRGWAAVVLAAGLGVTSTPAHADTLVGRDTSGLISAITTANSAGSGTLDLSTGCTYTLESGPYGGGDGLPVVTGAITIHGSGATITRDPSAAAFRLIEVAGSGSLTADHLTLSHGNADTQPAGGIYSVGGSVTLTDTTVSSNTSSVVGGGIESGGGTLSLTNSTVSGNTGYTGGGITSSGTLTLTNTTVAGNGASNGNGGIEFNGGTETLTNTIVANNSDPNCNVPVTDGGYNLDSGTTCGLSQPTSKPMGAPDLGPLQNNGGPTPTMALASFSEAIDTIPSGANGCGTTITTDQRGVPRPQGGGCDMGAYESGDVAMQSLTANHNPVPRLSKLTYTATVSNDGAADGTGVTVTDTVPAGEKYKSAAASQGSCSVLAQKVTCNLGQVPAAATATVTIVVKIKAASGSMLSDTATVNATTGTRWAEGASFQDTGDKAPCGIGSASVTEANQRQIVAALAVMRIAIGAAFALGPHRLDGRKVHSRADTLMTRSFAVREVTLGVGGLLATVGAGASPSTVRMWAGLGALTDGGDLAVSLVGVRQDEPSAWVPALVATAGLVAEGWAFFTPV